MRPIMSDESAQMRLLGGFCKIVRSLTWVGRAGVIAALTRLTMAWYQIVMLFP